MGEGKGLKIFFFDSWQIQLEKAVLDINLSAFYEGNKLKERHNILSQLLKHKTMLNLRETSNHLFNKEEK